MLIRKTFPFQSLVGIGLVLLQSPIGVAADEAKNRLVVTVTKGFRHSSIPTAEAVLGALAEVLQEGHASKIRIREGVKGWVGLCSPIEASSSTSTSRSP